MQWAPRRLNNMQYPNLVSLLRIIPNEAGVISTASRQLTLGPGKTHIYMQSEQHRYIYEKVVHIQVCVHIHIYKYVLLQICILSVSRLYIYYYSHIYGLLFPQIGRHTYIGMCVYTYIQVCTAIDMYTFSVKAIYIYYYSCIYGSLFPQIGRHSNQYFMMYRIHAIGYW